MSATSAISVPDSTDATISLLRELRHGHLRRQAASLAFWLYVAGLLVFVYGGWLVAAVVRALRHPEPALAGAGVLLRATPVVLCALALLLLAALLWDARWRGPVTVSQPTADWLLDTPVRRERVLRPRYWVSVLLRLLAGAVAGLVPATLLLAGALGGGGVRDALALAGAAMLGTALLAGLGTGVAAVAEAHPGSRPLRPAPAVARYAVVAAVLLAVLAAAGALPSWAGAALLWSGPWGWAAQGLVALSVGGAPLWPLATCLLAVSAAVVIVIGSRAAARVPAAALRARARTIGTMSAAAANLDTRRVATAYRAATGGYSRVRIRLRPPRHSALVLPWRDLMALARAPARLGWAALLLLASAGLGALAVRAPHASLLPLAGAFGLAYLAAANLCEGARLDADDKRRSGQLPFRYDALVWWHAIVPCLLLAVIGGIPAAALAITTGKIWLLPVLAAAVPALAGGALVNSYRGPLEAEALAYGFETPIGNTASITIALWYLSGPLLSVGPLIWLGYRAISSPRPGTIAETVAIALGIAAWLRAIAGRRARQL